jgi:hypothetical protein
MRKPSVRRKTPDRRKSSSTAWVLGGALPEDRRVGPERRTRLKDRRRRI